MYYPHEVPAKPSYVFLNSSAAMRSTAYVQAVRKSTVCYDLDLPPFIFMRCFLVLVLWTVLPADLLSLNHSVFTYVYCLLSYPSLITYIFHLLCPALCSFPSQLDCCFFNLAVMLSWFCAQQKGVLIQQGGKKRSYTPEESKTSNFLSYDN